MKDQHSYSQSKSLWICSSYKPKPSQLRLFCFPYGAGGASLYREWQKKMPSDIAILPIQLPGCENRIHEKAIENIDELISILKKILASEFQHPFAIYGHSLGGFIGYRLALELSKNPKYKKQLKHLFIGACSPPQRFAKKFNKVFIEPFQDLGFRGIPDREEILASTDEQMEELGKILKVNPKKYHYLLQNRDYLNLMLPKVMADLKIVESCVEFNAEQLNKVPVTVFHGEGDDRITLSQMKAWKKLTSGPFDIQIFPGNHFFLHPNQFQDELINKISSKLTN